MNAKIKVNGVEREVVNSFSSGPGCAPHSYQLKRNVYLLRIGANWQEERPGQHPFRVTVEIN